MRRVLTPDENFMKTALTEARRAYRLGETPIGCVIVRTHDYDGNALPAPQIIARGYNRRNTEKSTLAHAEIRAIRRAARILGDWRLEGCTIYVTLEPCQMCAGALVQSRIDRVVIGAMNRKAGCAGSVLNILEEPRFNHQAVVDRGVLEAECSSLMSGFFREMREKNRKKTAEQECEKNRKKTGEQECEKNRKKNGEQERGQEADLNANE